MPLKINKKEFESLKNSSKKDIIESISLQESKELFLKNKKRTSIDRLKDATCTLKKYPVADKIYLSKDTIILDFIDIALVSNNDLLRIDNREIYAFKLAWHERVANLLKGVDLSNWDTKNHPVIIEFLYKTKNAKNYDPDSIVSAFKSTLDGLVCSGVLKDDTVEHIPLIIPRQEKYNIGEKKLNKINTLTIVISPANELEKYYTDTFKKVLKNKNLL